MPLVRALTVLSLMLLLAAAASASPIVCDTPGNLVQNCGFEDGIASWAQSGDWSTGYNDPSPAYAHSGSLSLKDGNSPSQGSAGVIQTITDTPGAVYTLSFWLLQSGDNSGGGQGYTVSWGGQPVLIQTNQPSSPWTLFTYTVTGTGSDTLQLGGYSDHGYNYLDDVMLTLAPDNSLCNTPGNLIQNCGFENGTTYWNRYGNWSTGYNDPSPGAAHSGIQSLKDGNLPSQGAAGASQTIVDTPGTVYTLSFWLLQSADNSGGGQEYDVSWGNQSLLAQSNQSSTPWTLFTYNVVGTGSDTVQFGGYSDHGYNYLDDIALTPAQVPEPGTLGLVLAGLVVVAARIYRRRT